MAKFSEQIKRYLENRTEAQANEDENLLMRYGRMSGINETVDKLHPIVRDFLQTTDIEEIVSIKKAMDLRDSAALEDIYFVLDDILSADENNIIVRVLDKDINALVDMLSKHGFDKKRGILTVTLGRNYIDIYHFEKILKECGFSDVEIGRIFV